MESLKGSGVDGVLKGLLEHIVATRPLDPLRELHNELVAHNFAVARDRKRQENATAKAAASPPKKTLPTLPVDERAKGTTSPEDDAADDDADVGHIDDIARILQVAAAVTASPGDESVVTGTNASFGGQGGPLSPTSRKIGADILRRVASEHGSPIGLGGTFRVENFSFGGKTIVIDNTRGDADSDDAMLADSVKWEDLEPDAADVIEELAGSANFDGTVKWADVAAILDDRKGAAATVSPTGDAASGTASPGTGTKRSPSPLAS